MLRFLLAAALVVVVVLILAVQALASPVLTGIVRDAGLVATDVEVSVDMIGPALLTGRAESVHVTARNVEVPHGVVARMDLVLDDVSVVDRTFEAVRGTLEDVRVRAPGGARLTVRRVALEGPATRTRAMGSIEASEVERLISSLAADQGLTLDDVELRDGRLRVTSGGASIDATLRVAGRALILESAGRSTVLLAPSSAEPWRLDRVRIERDGITIDLEVDARVLVQSVGAVGP